MEENLSWMGLIDQAINEGELLGSTCALHSKLSNTGILTTLQSDRCLCGRLIRKHSFTGSDKPAPPDPNDVWAKNEHASSAPVTVFGILQNKIKFVRFDYTRPSTSKPKSGLPKLVEILLADAKNKKPTLVISCYGGAKYFKMNDKLKKEFSFGIGQVAATQGVWLITAGLNSGVSKVIGQSVWMHQLLNENSNDYTLIGLTSWGCLSNETHDVLRNQAKLNSYENIKRRESIAKMNAPLEARNISSITFDENQSDTLEINHTHSILLDDGTQGDHIVEIERREDGSTKIKTDRYYITDKPRSDIVNELINITQCHSVTIIVEGGLGSLDVINNDLTAKPPRPIVFVYGSGRLANALGDLLELARQDIEITDEEIKRHLTKVSKHKNLKSHIETMKFILLPKNRSYLNIFKLDDNTNLTDTIFLAVFRAEVHQRKEMKSDIDPDTSINSLKELLNLSIQWDYLKGIDYVFQNKDVINYHSQFDHYLFEKALINNRPAFIDYFFRQQYNILDTNDYIQFHKRNMPRLEENNQLQEDDQNIRGSFARKFLIENLYGKSTNHFEIHSLVDLNNFYYQMVGPYAQSFFRKRSRRNRFQTDFKHILKSFFSRCLKLREKISKSHSNSSKNQVSPVQTTTVNFPRENTFSEMPELYKVSTKYDSEEMLRDIFLWSVIHGYSEMSFIFLLQMKSRIISSLIAAGLTRSFRSKTTGYLDQWHQFKKQSVEYELFATACIDHCYQRNERLACQLLLREIPLYGNITCMQVAIRFRLKSFVNSRCFDRVLNRQWNGALSETTNKTLSSKISFILSLFTLGVLAPVLLDYRNDHIHDKQQDIEDENEKTPRSPKFEGIADQKFDEMGFWTQIRHFHRTPLVRS